MFLSLNVPIICQETSLLFIVKSYSLAISALSLSTWILRNQTLHPLVRWSFYLNSGSLFPSVCHHMHIICSLTDSFLKQLFTKGANIESRRLQDCSKCPLNQLPPLLIVSSSLMNSKNSLQHRKLIEHTFSTTLKSTRITLTVSIHAKTHQLSLIPAGMCTYFITYSQN